MVNGNPVNAKRDLSMETVRYRAPGCTGGYSGDDGVAEVYLGWWWTGHARGVRLPVMPGVLGSVS